MSTTDRHAADPSDPDAPAGQAPEQRRNRWIWVSAVLAIVALGLLIWGVATRSDLDSTKQDLERAQEDVATAQQELASTNEQLASTEQELESTTQDAEEQQVEDDGGANAGAVAAAGALFNQFADQLDATQEDLAATQKDLEEAQKAAAQADEDAEAAKQKAADANSETEKAQAQAEQATAEAEAAESRAAVAVDCAKAFIGALGGLFEGDDVSAQAAAVREQLAGITADCQEQFARLDSRSSRAS